MISNCEISKIKTLSDVLKHHPTIFQERRKGHSTLSIVYKILVSMKMHSLGRGFSDSEVRETAVFSVYKSFGLDSVTIGEVSCLIFKNKKEIPPYLLSECPSEL